MNNMLIDLEFAVFAALNDDDIDFKVIPKLPESNVEIVEVDVLTGIPVVNWTIENTARAYGYLDTEDMLKDVAQSISLFCKTWENCIKFKYTWCVTKERNIKGKSIITKVRMLFTYSQLFGSLRYLKKMQGMKSQM